MWRPLEGYGAVGDCGCGCSSGFGAAPARRYPSVEKVLRDYIANKVGAGQYFWINPQLNTAAVRQAGFGNVSILSNLTDAITNAATSIGDTFASAWGSAAAASGADSSGASGSSSDGYVSPNLDPSLTTFDPSALYPTLPSDVAAPAANAAKKDLLNTPSTWIIGGAAFLGLVLLLSVRPPSKGRRR